MNTLTRSFLAAALVLMPAAAMAESHATPVADPAKPAVTQEQSTTKEVKTEGMKAKEVKKDEVKKLESTKDKTGSEKSEKSGDSGTIPAVPPATAQ